MYLKDLYGVIISIILLHVKIFKKIPKKREETAKFHTTQVFSLKIF